MGVYAGLDIATTSGITVFDGERLVLCQAFRPRGDDNGTIFCGFRSFLIATIASFRERGMPIEIVAIEEPLRTDIEITVATKDGKGVEKKHPVTSHTFRRIYGLVGHAEEICATRNIPVRFVHQATWRKAFTGNGHAKKEDTLALAQRIDRNIKSKDAAESLGVAWWLKGQMNPAMRDLFKEAS